MKSWRHLPGSRGLHILGVTVCAFALLAFQGDRGAESRADLASPGKDAVERWDTYPAESVERQRVVGRLALTLRVGMTRREVEAVIGPGDDPRDIPFEGDNKQFVSKLYLSHLPHLPAPPAGCSHGLDVVYEVNGPVQTLHGIWRQTLHAPEPVLVP